MKKLIAGLVLFAMSVSALADDTLPIVSFSVGFGKGKAEVQQLNMLGFRDGTDYKLNALEDDADKGQLRLFAIIAGVTVLAVLLNASDFIQDSDEEPLQKHNCRPYGTLNACIQ